jgi:alpha-L-fucosidase
MPGGYIPWEQQLRLVAMGEWLKVNGAAIYASRPHEVTRLETDEEIAVRLTRGHDGHTYAIVCGRPSSATVTIDGLPSGDVTWLLDGGRVLRRGDVLTLPTRPDDTPAWTLRIS